MQVKLVGQGNLQNHSKVTPLKINYQHFSVLSKYFHKMHNLVWCTIILKCLSQHCIFNLSCVHILILYSIFCSNVNLTFFFFFFLEKNFELSNSVFLVASMRTF